MHINLGKMIDESKLGKPSFAEHVCSHSEPKLFAQVPSDCLPLSDNGARSLLHTSHGLPEVSDVSFTIRLRLYDRFGLWMIESRPGMRRVSHYVLLLTCSKSRFSVF